MKRYLVRAGDGVSEWNVDYYEFEASNDEEAEIIAQKWFDKWYVPEVLADLSSYSWYPNEEDYDNEEKYLQDVHDVEAELAISLSWEFVDLKKLDF